MPWIIQREDTVAGHTTTTVLDPNNPDSFAFPTELQDPSNPTQPIVIADLAQRYKDDPTLARPAHTISSQLVWTSDDPNLFIPKIVLTHIRIPASHDSFSFNMPKWPENPFILLHSQVYSQNLNQTNYDVNRAFLKKEGIDKPCPVMAQGPCNAEGLTSDYSLCPLWLYSKEQLNLLIDFLKKSEVPGPIIQLVLERRKLASPEEVAFNKRLEDLRNQPEALDDAFKGLLDDANRLIEQLSFIQSECHFSIINDEPLYKLSELCGALGRINLAKNALLMIVEKAARKDGILGNNYHYYEETAARELCGIILMGYREHGQVLPATAIESLIALDNMDITTSRAVTEFMTACLLPIYFNIAGGFPFGYKPEELESSDNSNVDSHRTRTMLHVLGALTGACRDRYNKIASSHEEIAALRERNSLLENQVQTLQKQKSTLLTFSSLAARPNDENNTVPTLQRRRSFS